MALAALLTLAPPARAQSGEGGAAGTIGRATAGVAGEAETASAAGAAGSGAEVGAAGSGAEGGVDTAANGAAAAKGKAMLSGTVTDTTTGKGVVDAVVSLLSGAEEEVVVSDATGRYRIPNVKPGKHTLRFEADAHVAQVREITVAAGASVAVDVAMAIDTSPPIVIEMSCAEDTLSSASATAYQRSNLLPLRPLAGPGGQALPFGQLAALAEPSGYVLGAGAATPESAFAFEGFSPGLAGLGVPALPLSTRFVSDATFIEEGYMPEYGRAGRAIVVIDRIHSSNRSRGSVFGSITDYPGARGNGRGVGPVAETGTEFSGALVENKLFFHVGALVARAPDGRGTGATLRADDGARLEPSVHAQYVAKLDYRASDDDRLSLSARGSPVWSGAGGSPLDPRVGPLPLAGRATADGALWPSRPGVAHTSAANELLASWEHTADNKKRNAVTELGWQAVRTRTRLDERALTSPDAASLPGALRVDRLRARQSLRWLFEGLGHHVAKGGAELEYASLTQGRGFFERPDALPEGEAQGAPTNAAPRRRANTLAWGAYVQDGWAFSDWLTLNLGARYDASYAYERGSRLTLSLPSQWSPRAGVVIDPTSEGRSRITFSYARYYANLPLAALGLVAEGAAVAPNLSTPSSSEYGAAADVRAGRAVVLGLAYLRRTTQGAFGDLPLSVAPEGAPPASNPAARELGGAPAAERSFDALTLHATKKFRNDWLAYASYTIASLRGQRFAAAGPPTISWGPLPGDHRHEVKLYAAREWHLSTRGTLETGLAHRSRSGGPADVVATLTGDGSEAARLWPGEGGARLPARHDLDLHVGYRYVYVDDSGPNLDPGLAPNITLTLDVFNVLNLQALTSADPRGLTPAAEPGGMLGAGPLHQEPLAARFGLATTFLHNRAHRLATGPGALATLELWCSRRSPCGRKPRGCSISIRMALALQLAAAHDPPAYRAGEAAPERPLRCPGGATRGRSRPSAPR